MSNNKILRLERTLDENIIQNWFDDFDSVEESFGEDSDSDEDIVLRSDHEPILKKRQLMPIIFT